MQPVLFVNYNGTLFKENEFFLSHKNRAFRFGDGLFETMHASGIKVQYLDSHFARLIQGLRILKMEVPSSFNLQFIEKSIEYLLNRNHLFTGARIRLSIFRSGEGVYTPENNNISFLIESSPLERDVYFLNEKGYTMDVFTEHKKPVSSLSGFKSMNSLLYVLAGSYKKEHALDECILLNERNHISETISSNIFLVKGSKIATPPLADGCVAGVMREQIIRIARVLKINAIDSISVSIDDLKTADEVFVSNAITGIRWIVAFQNKRYYNKMSKLLINAINEDAFK